ncbi:MAG: hypothetical protein K0R54_4999 [Clostridiaceae bacterium]|jgi:lia operon protein LiaG|nr:hypothetical protein [Clostridiaceae bacterium]
MFENKNMKKLVMWLALIVVVCFGISFLILNITGGFKRNYGFNFGNLAVSNDSKDYSVNDEKSAAIDGINEISVEASSADINIIPEKRNDVKAHLYGNINATFETKLYLNASGGVMEISADKQRGGSFSVFGSSLKLDIFVPENYNNNLKIKTSSGKINAVNKMNLKDVSLNLTSGNVILKDLTCENLTAKCSSGAIEGENIITKSADIGITSGSINLTAFKGNLEGETTSGKIYIDYSDFDNNVDLKATSGNIELRLPDYAQFKLQSKATSGRVSCKFPITVDDSEKRNELNGVVGNGKNSVNVNTTSGNVVISKK